MKVAFSKSFIKAASRLSGKMKDSLREIILEVEISVNDILYIDMESAIGVSLEITETDATSGWIRFSERMTSERMTSERMTIEYKNLTKDSVTLILYEDGATPVYEARTPAGWGLTVNNYVDLTPTLQ